MRRAMRAPGRFATVVLVLGAAFAAALLSHVAIDVAGDYVLRHDAYDGVAHGSRAIVALEVLLLLTIAAAGYLGAAFKEARGLRTGLCAALDQVAPRTPWRFVAAVVSSAFATLIAMEWLDTLPARGAFDLSELLGGSFWLGAGIEVAAGSAIALFAWYSVRRLRASHPRIVRAVAFFVAPFAYRSRADAVVRIARREPQTPRRKPSIIARRAAKRGPPGLLR